MTHALAQQKADLRDRMKRVLAGMGEKARLIASCDACDRLMRTAHYAAARSIMLYCPIQHEIDVAAVARGALADAKVLCVPRVDWAEGTMLPARVTDWRHGLVTGRLGVREPAPGAEAIAPSSLDLIVVPGLSFDAAGGRLGRGSGFYDRFLAGLSAASVGLALDEQIVERVPMGAGDARLDAVITPTRVLARAGATGW
jgi:5-formyltetrahydrofolate cyclo-ligase